MRGEGSITSPFEVDDDEPRTSGLSSESSDPRTSSHPYREKIEIRGGQRASRRDGRRMFARQKVKASKRVSIEEDPRARSPSIPTPPSPAPQPLIQYGDRLIPLDLESLRVREPVANSSPPLFIEGSSGRGIGWRSPFLSGTATSADFEDMARSRIEYDFEDLVGDMSGGGNYDDGVRD